MTGTEPQNPSDSASGRGGPVRRHAVVPLELAGHRVDRAAALMFDDFSRVMLSDWIQSGCLTVDGAVVRPKVKLLGGETLRLEAELTPREDWQAADPVAYEVVHADAHLLVVNKPPGLVVHPGAGNPRGTLVNGLLNDYPGLAALPRAGIVHRLDKDTSGLLLVARTLECRNRLVRMIAGREVSREYLAVVEGRLAADCTIDAPIGRDPQRRTRQAIRADGRPALTRVRVRTRFAAHTLVEASLETGRTHQIRVHLASRGHPLVGDSRYGARRLVPPQADPDTVATLRAFSRQALHAWRLGLSHPMDGQSVRLAADPPDDFARLVAALGAEEDVMTDHEGDGASSDRATACWVTPQGGNWPPHLGALTTTRVPPPELGRAGRYGWNLATHVDDHPAALAAQRQALQSRAGVTAIQWMNQVHGGTCFQASPATVNRLPEADALWTSSRGLGLAALTADCVPVVLGDRHGRVAAVAHGGWRGLVGGVIENLVRSLPAAPQDLVAWLGPAIGPAAYQIGAEVVAGLEQQRDGAVLARRTLKPDPEPGRYRLDLFELAAALLERAGVGQVSSERYCTFADTRFYSFRRDGQTGRMATVAWLR